jgi:hypothetical protein
MLSPPPLTEHSEHRSPPQSPMGKNPVLRLITPLSSTTTNEQLRSIVDLANKWIPTYNDFVRKLHAIQDSRIPVNASEYEDFRKHHNKTKSLFNDMKTGFFVLKDGPGSWPVDDPASKEIEQKVYGYAWCEAKMGRVLKALDDNGFIQ